MIFGFEVVSAKPKKAAQEDAPTQQPMRPAGIRSAPSTDQKRVRRQMARQTSPQTTTARTAHQETSMTTNASEVDLLRAMAVATPREQVRLAADLEALRARRTASLRNEASVDLANTVVAAHLTPVITHVRHTAHTDWMDEGDSPAGDPTMAMKTEAALWFRRTSAEVREDHEEFATQAQGTARRVASRHGEQAEVAERAFLDHAAHLHRMAGEAIDPSTQNGNAESTVTDYATDAGQEPFLGEDWEDTGDTAVHPTLPGAGEGVTGKKFMFMDELGDQFNVEHDDEEKAREIAQAQAATPVKKFKGSRHTANCADCGAAIERDPEGEKNRSYHHNDGSKHDHAAKPGKESSVTAGKVSCVQCSGKGGSCGACAGLGHFAVNTKPLIASKTAGWVDTDDPDPEFYHYDAEGIGEATVSMEIEGNPAEHTGRWEWDAFTYDDLPKRGTGVESTLEAAKERAEDHVNSGQMSLFGQRRTSTEQNGLGESGLEDVEVGDEGDKPMWPWEMEQNTPGTGAANVAGTPTPGGESGYPQPTNAARKAGSEGYSGVYYDVACPSCGAQSGESCKNSVGGAADPHYARIKAWDPEKAKGFHNTSSLHEAMVRRAKLLDYTAPEGYQVLDLAPNEIKGWFSDRGESGGMEGLWLLNDAGDTFIGLADKKTKQVIRIHPSDGKRWSASPFDRGGSPQRPDPKVRPAAVWTLAEGPRSVYRVAASRRTAGIPKDHQDALNQFHKENPGHGNQCMVDSASGAECDLEEGHSGPHSWANTATSAFRAAVAHNLRRQASDGPWFVTHDSPVYGGENAAGPFATRSEAEAALAAWSGPKHGHWYVSDIDHSGDHEDFGPADGDWSSWLVQNNID